MGFIPLFLTASAACLLFFLTVRNTLRIKVQRQLALAAELVAAHPNCGLTEDEAVVVEKLQELLKEGSTQEQREMLREMRINQYQYNTLIKKAPYNWVAAFGGFKAI